MKLYTDLVDKVLPRSRLLSPWRPERGCILLPGGVKAEGLSIRSLCDDGGQRAVRPMPMVRWDFQRDYDGAERQEVLS